MTNNRHLTLYSVTESMKLLQGTAVTLLTLGPTVLLEGGHGERLLQSQHDLIHLNPEELRALRSVLRFLTLNWN